MATQYPANRRVPIYQHYTANAAVATRSSFEGLGIAQGDSKDSGTYTPVNNGKTMFPPMRHAQSQNFLNRQKDSGLQSLARLPTDLSIPGRSSSKQQELYRRAAEPTTDANAPVESPSSRPSRANSEASSYETRATSIPALQTKGALDENDAMEPLHEDEIDPGSYDLVAPPQDGVSQYSLETRSELLFSTEHLRIIFDDPSLLLRFTTYLSNYRHDSLPMLVYYLDALKALRAIAYANAIEEALDPIPGFDFTSSLAIPAANIALEEKAESAFQVMVRDDLPAYIAHIYTQTVSLSISRRITGTLPPHLRDASEGLAEVFCLTDPSRSDNPIVFASEEFHRTTQYGMNYVIGRNCRFLQGPKTNPYSVDRLRDRIKAGVEHCEIFLNYRRDGSPFMNLLMVAPLCDSRGTVRYFIGAQVDVSGLVKECYNMESLKRLVAQSEHDDGSVDGAVDEKASQERDEFRDLTEMFNLQELETVRRAGGRMHKEQQEEGQEGNGSNTNWNKTRVLIQDSSPDGTKSVQSFGRPSGKLGGVYEHYLLVRPYPSLKIIFASPSLRVPGILQSSFMAKVGGSSRVRDELTQALADGRGVTAKIRWISKHNVEGRNRWIHCTPLIGSNGAIGVWMVVLIDDDTEESERQFRQAPPIDPRFGRPAHLREDDAMSIQSGSLRDFDLVQEGRGTALSHISERPQTAQSLLNSPRIERPQVVQIGTPGPRMDSLRRTEYAL